MSKISWNWLDNDNLLSENGNPLVYSGTIYTTDNDMASSGFSEIPVKKVTLNTSGKEQIVSNEMIVEKISLILYNFNEYNLSPENIEILKNIYPKITSNAVVSVYGHTDDIGPDDANRSLSTNRARVVQETIKRNRVVKDIKYRGLGKRNPIYSNLSPEGRFYNRTVQIIIEKDVK